VIVVYTTIFGGSDSLKAAPSGASRCVCFVDDPSIYAGQTRGWELVKHPAPDPRREAWYLRCIAHRLFPEARKTVWIDASFTLTNLPRLLLASANHDLSGLRHHARNSCYDEGREIIKVGQADAASGQAQLSTYRGVGFSPAGLTISCILVRTNTPNVVAFNERWDAEIQKHPGDNTQMSIDYAAWKSGLSWHHLQGVRKNNPYAIHDHDDHKVRRQPYASSVKA
jgi:hypothetical protein